MASLPSLGGDDPFSDLQAPRRAGGWQPRERRTRGPRAAAPSSAGLTLEPAEAEDAGGSSPARRGGSSPSRRGGSPARDASTPPRDASPAEQTRSPSPRGRSASAGSAKAERSPTGQRSSPRSAAGGSPQGRRDAEPAAEDAPSEEPPPAAAERAGRSLTFEGHIVADTGAETECIVSFPGQQESAWKRITARNEARQRDTNAACVFFGDGHRFYGKHVLDTDTGQCYCHSIYGGEQPWGCKWLEMWQKNVQQAVDRKHTLVVCCPPGQSGEGKVRWRELGLTAQERLAQRADGSLRGLGVSQAAEVAWLERKGWDFEERDVLTLLNEELDEAKMLDAIEAKLEQLDAYAAPNLFSADGPRGPACADIAARLLAEAAGSAEPASVLRRCTEAQALGALLLQWLETRHEPTIPPEYCEECCSAVDDGETGFRSVLHDGDSELSVSERLGAVVEGLSKFSAAGHLRLVRVVLILQKVERVRGHTTTQQLGAVFAPKLFSQTWMGEQKDERHELAERCAAEFVGMLIKRWVSDDGGRGVEEVALESVALRVRQLYASQRRLDTKQQARDDATLQYELAEREQRLQDRALATLLARMQRFRGAIVTSRVNTIRRLCDEVVQAELRVDHLRSALRRAAIYQRLRDQEEELCVLEEAQARREFLSKELAAADSNVERLYREIDREARLVTGDLVTRAHQDAREQQLQDDVAALEKEIEEEKEGLDARNGALREDWRRLRNNVTTLQRMSLRGGQHDGSPSGRVAALGRDGTALGVTRRLQSVEETLIEWEEELQQDALMQSSAGGAMLRGNYGATAWERGVVTQAGWLMRRSAHCVTGSLASWKRQFFQVEAGVLSCYSAPPAEGGALQEHLMLQGGTEVHPITRCLDASLNSHSAAAERQGRRWCFVTVPPSGPLVYLQAVTGDERTQWVDAISVAVARPDQRDQMALNEHAIDDVVDSTLEGAGHEARIQAAAAILSGATRDSPHLLLNKFDPASLAWGARHRALFWLVRLAVCAHVLLGFLEPSLSAPEVGTTNQTDSTDEVQLLSWQPESPWSCVLARIVELVLCAIHVVDIAFRLRLCLKWSADRWLFVKLGVSTLCMAVSIALLLKASGPCRLGEHSSSAVSSGWLSFCQLVRPLLLLDNCRSLQSLNARLVTCLRALKRSSCLGCLLLFFYASVAQIAFLDTAQPGDSDCDGQLKNATAARFRTLHSRVSEMLHLTFGASSFPDAMLPALVHCNHERLFLGTKRDDDTVGDSLDIIVSQLLTVLFFVSFLALMLYLVLNVMLGAVYAASLRCDTLEAVAKGGRRRAALLLVFRLCDLDGNGTIQKAALKDLFRECALRTSCCRRESLGGKFDVERSLCALGKVGDGRGSIDLDEFFQLVDLMDRPQAVRVAPPRWIRAGAEWHLSGLPVEVQDGLEITTLLGFDLNEYLRQREQTFEGMEDGELRQMCKNTGGDRVDAQKKELIKHLKGAAKKGAEQAQLAERSRFRSLPLSGATASAAAAAGEAIAEDAVMKFALTWDAPHDLDLHCSSDFEPPAPRGQNSTMVRPPRRKGHVSYRENSSACGGVLEQMTQANREVISWARPYPGTYTFEVHNDRRGRSTDGARFKCEISFPFGGIVTSPELQDEQYKTAKPKPALKSKVVQPGFVWKHEGNTLDWAGHVAKFIFKWHGCDDILGNIQARTPRVQRARAVLTALRPQLSALRSATGDEAACEMSTNMKAKSAVDVCVIAAPARGNPGGDSTQHLSSAVFSGEVARRTGAENDAVQLDVVCDYGDTQRGCVHGGTLARQLRPIFLRTGCMALQSLLHLLSVVLVVIAAASTELCLDAVGVTESCVAGPGAAAWTVLLMCCVVLFLDMALKVLAFGLSGYWNTKYHRRDGVVTLSNLLGMLFLLFADEESNGWNRLGRMLVYTRLWSALRIGRQVEQGAASRKLDDTFGLMWRLLCGLGPYAVYLALLLYAYAAIGTFAFGIIHGEDKGLLVGSSYDSSPLYWEAVSFSDLSAAYLSILQVLFQSDWATIHSACADAVRAYHMARGGCGRRCELLVWLTTLYYASFQFLVATVLLFMLMSTIIRQIGAEEKIDDQRDARRLATAAEDGAAPNSTACYTTLELQLLAERASRSQSGRPGCEIPSRACAAAWAGWLSGPIGRLCAPWAQAWYAAFHPRCTNCGRSDAEARTAPNEDHTVDVQPKCRSVFLPTFTPDWCPGAAANGEWRGFEPLTLCQHCEAIHRIKEAELFGAQPAASPGTRGTGFSASDGSSDGKPSTMSKRGLDLEKKGAALRASAQAEGAVLASVLQQLKTEQRQGGERISKWQDQAATLSLSRLCLRAVSWKPGSPRGNRGEFGEEISLPIEHISWVRAQDKTTEHKRGRDIPSDCGFLDCIFVIKMSDGYDGGTHHILAAGSAEERRRWIFALTSRRPLLASIENPVPSGAASCAARALLDHPLRAHEDKAEGAFFSSAGDAAGSPSPRSFAGGSPTSPGVHFTGAVFGVGVQQQPATEKHEPSFLVEVIERLDELGAFGGAATTVWGELAKGARDSDVVRKAADLAALYSTGEASSDVLQRSDEPAVWAALLRKWHKDMPSGGRLLSWNRTNRAKGGNRDARERAQALGTSQLGYGMEVHAEAEALLMELSPVQRGAVLLQIQKWGRLDREMAGLTEPMSMERMLAEWWADPSEGGSAEQRKETEAYAGFVSRLLNLEPSGNAPHMAEALEELKAERTQRRMEAAEAIIEATSTPSENKSGPVSDDVYTCVVRAPIQDGLELSSKTIGMLRVGERVPVLDEQTAESGNGLEVHRVKFSRGWVSATTERGAPVLELRRVGGKKERILSTQRTASTCVVDFGRPERDRSGQFSILDSRGGRRERAEREQRPRRRQRAPAQTRSWARTERARKEQVEALWKPQSGADQ